MRLCMIVAFSIMSFFAILLFAVPRGLQFPLVVIGGFTTGFIVGTSTKTLRRGIPGGYLSAFLGTMLGGTIAFVQGLVSQTGALEFSGYVFWAAFGLIWSGAVGLVAGVIGAVGSALSSYVLKKIAK